MDIDSYIESRRDLISNKLNDLIAHNSALPYAQLFEAAQYSLFGAAKRLRPLLALATAETFGASIEKAITPALAIELVHTYSLIHDDLPCMDNDDFRRGKPSLHKAYTEGHAVLTGDYLLTFAFELLTDCAALTDDQKVALIKVLAKKAGADGMIGGQVVDLANTGRIVDWPMLQLMHSKKTGALITSALLFGGIIAGVSSTEMEKLRLIGQHLGLAFQIIDDILDQTEDAGCDCAHQKTTAITLLGIDEAQALATDLFEKANAHLNEMAMQQSFLPHLAKKLIYRSS